MDKMDQNVINEIAWREEWIPVGQAAQELSVHPGKLSNLIKGGHLETKKDVLDQRKTLVQRQAVYELFRRKPHPLN